MTIIVTGGAGFIGSNFIHEWFSNENEDLINIDCLTYAGNLENLKVLNENKLYHFYKNRIGDKSDIEKILNRFNPRAIINFAAESHVDKSIYGPESFFKTNVMETLSLLEVTKNYYDQMPEISRKKFKFIHISTDEVFGSLQLNEKPFKESSPYLPNSPYAASKAASDHLVRSFNKTHKLPCIISNCSNNYGPFQYPEKLIPLVINNALNLKDLPVYGKGNQIRDWLHVKDHCKAIITILEDGAPSDTYNIGGSCEMENIEVIKIICNSLDNLRPRKDKKKYEDLIKFVSDRPGHDLRYAINSDKIMKELKWKPKIKFSDGINDTIEWYLNSSEWLMNVLDKSYDIWMNKNYNKR